MSDTAPYEVTSTTSQQAAESLTEHALNRLEERVYRTLLDAKDGLTDEELEKALAMRHQTVSARRRELVLAGLVTDRGETRRGTSGRSQTVWHAVARVQAKKLPPRVKRPSPEAIARAAEILSTVDDDDTVVRWLQDGAR